MSGYDAWLERPYVEAAKRDAEFEQWCEQFDVDPEDDDAFDRFEEHLEALAQDDHDDPDLLNDLRSDR